MQQNAWPEEERRKKRANSIELAPCRRAIKGKSLDIEIENLKMPPKSRAAGTDAGATRGVEGCVENRCNLRVMKSARWWKEDVRDDVVKNEGAEKRRRAAALGALLGCWAALRPFSTMGPAETSLTNMGRCRTVRGAAVHLAIGKPGGVDRVNAHSPRHCVLVIDGRRILYRPNSMIG